MIVIQYYLVGLNIFLIIPTTRNNTYEIFCLTNCLFVRLFWFDWLLVCLLTLKFWLVLSISEILLNFLDSIKCKVDTKSVKLIFSPFKKETTSAITCSSWPRSFSTLGMLSLLRDPSPSLSYFAKHFRTSKNLSFELSDELLDLICMSRSRLELLRFNILIVEESKKGV